MTFRKNTYCPISNEIINPFEKNLGCSQCLHVFKEKPLVKWLLIKYQCPFKCKNSVFCAVLNWEKKIPNEIFV